MKKKLLNIFFLLNMFNHIYSIYQLSEIVKNYNFGDFSDPDQKDLGQCTCNLTAICDYNCPCDEACTSEDKEKFNTKEIDVSKYNKDRMEDFKCKSLEEVFDYNKNKAGINVKDHIFNLMCIHFDRSGDLGEFYLSEPKEGEATNKARDWVNHFFQTESNLGTDQREIFKPDSNGYCIKSIVSESKTNEYSCIATEINVTQLNSRNVNVNKYGNGNYNASVKIKGDSIDVLETNFNSNIKNFKILSRTENENQNGRPMGYIQGSPIKIRLNNDLYDQYYFPIINNNGQCARINEDNNNFNMKTILFKNNAIYSCILGNNNYMDTEIYNLLCNSIMTICRSPNDCNSQQISCPNITNMNSVGINIQLDIYISKEGKEYNPHEIINNSTITLTPYNEQVLMFKVKFIDVSYSSYINTKNGKITSLIPLSDNLIKSNILTERDK